MTFRIEFRPEAFADIAEAFQFYEGRRRGLGQVFEEELHHTVQLLEEMATMGPEVYRRLRRVLMHRFPFAIYYRVKEDLVEVRGVIHTSQHPRRWQRRT